MNYISGQDRQQIGFSSLADGIEADNVVRFIDAFVDKIDLRQLGFEVKALKEEGRPPYDPKVLMKLYLYGYLNGVRSSRKLERECRCNVEVHWLLGKLQPNYHTIADFRKDNPKALKALFRLYVQMLRDLNLIGGEVLAIDGTKFRASNSKKNNYNSKKIERHLKYIEEKSAEYLKALEEADKEEADSSISLENIHQKLQQLQERKLKYEALQAQLDSSGQPQVSTTDPDSRAMLVQGQVVEVCYNQQASVDDKHNLLVATHTLNTNDRNALSRIAMESQKALEDEEIKAIAEVNIAEVKEEEEDLALGAKKSKKSLTVLADKGYHNGRELENTQKAGITTIVATSEAVNSNEYGTTPEYMVQHFRYNEEADTYTCPENQILRTKGTWHKKTRERDSYQYKKYRTSACSSCPVKKLCTGRAKGGREIERSQYAAAVERNAKTYQANKALYRKRQEINEHIFGTIKRQWNMDYTNLRTLKKVEGEMSFVMMIYNMKRSINIVGVKEMIAFLKEWQPNYRKVLLSCKKRPKYDRNAALLEKAYEQAA
jgi:transposase